MSIKSRSCSSNHRNCPIGKSHQKKKNAEITAANAAFKYTPQMIGKVPFGRLMIAKTPLYQAELLTRGISLEDILPNLKFSDLLCMIKINEYPLFLIRLT